MDMKVKFEFSETYSDTSVRIPIRFINSSPKFLSFLSVSSTKSFGRDVLKSCTGGQDVVSSRLRPVSYSIPANS